MKSKGRKCSGYPKCHMAFAYPTQKRKNLMNISASAAKRRKGTRGHACSECDSTLPNSPSFSRIGGSIARPGDGKKRGKLFKKCKRCDFRSSEKGLQHYAEHLLSHEQDSTPTSGPNGEEIFHSCNLCSETFILKVNLTLHKFWVHDPFATRLKCDICVDPVNYDSKEELISHLKLHGDKIHSCKSCSVSCSTLDGLLEHMLKHAPSKRLFCPECDALPPFTSIYNLYRHCSIEHKELKKMFDCSSCEKSFLTADLLRLHATKQHRIFDDKNGETFTETCGKDHEEVRFLCPHCPKSYADQFTLDEHIRIHTGEGAFTCPTCGKELSSKYALKSHERSHLELPKDPICVCDICGKELYSDTQLKRHMQSHREKKFQCSVCNLQFKRRDHLKSHSIIHSGARPFECEVCQKGFNRSDILRVHMKGVHGIVVDTKLSKKE
ncbi:PR domain zinc finger protein 5 [Orchesella cincta]|uniref:PR domain zinc finger protein 5 n=1 Tax=Orchesella cincta TaxID=48709 RepID=A0A1D2M4C7_ORCCI|nr:PR domain zinc finger protein 5 [Orchesella cincta]